MALYHESKGSGVPVVLLHEGIADCRMWEPQWQSFPESYRLVRCDFAGFGRSPVESLPLGNARDVAALLEQLEVTEAGVIGCSLGGRVALELAVGRPDLVGALVLGAAGLPGFDWSPAIRDYWSAEDGAVRRGDLDEATELNLRTWVDGPRRSPQDVDPAVRSHVAEMQRHALEVQAPLWETLDEELLVPDVAERLAEVRAPTLVLVGDEDVDDMHTIAGRLATTIPGARSATIPGAAHALSLEQPAAFDALVLGFLADVLRT